MIKYIPKDVHELALVLVNTLDLNVEQGVGAHFHLTHVLDVQRQTNLPRINPGFTDKNNGNRTLFSRFTSIHLRWNSGLSANFFNCDSWPRSFSQLSLPSVFVINPLSNELANALKKNEISQNQPIQDKQIVHWLSQRRGVMPLVLFWNLAAPK